MENETDYNWNLRCKSWFIAQHGKLLELATLKEINTNNKKKFNFKTMLAKKEDSVELSIMSLEYLIYFRLKRTPPRIKDIFGISEVISKPRK